MTLINKGRSADNFPCLYLTRVSINLLRPTSLSRLNARTAFATGYICPFKVVTFSTCTINSLGLSNAQSPASRRGGSDSILGQFIWDL